MMLLNGMAFPVGVRCTTPPGQDDSVGGPVTPAGVAWGYLTTALPWPTAVISPFWFRQEMSTVTRVPSSTSWLLL